MEEDLKKRKSRGILLHLLIVIMIVLLGISSNLDNIVIRTSTDYAFTKTISNKIMTTIADNLGISKLTTIDKIEENFNTSKEMEEIAKKVIQYNIDYVLHDKERATVLDLTEELTHLKDKIIEPLKKTMGEKEYNELDEQLSLTIKRLNIDINDVIKIYSRNSTLNPKMIKVIKCYKILSSIVFKLILLCLLILCIIISIIKEKYLMIFIKNSGIDLLISGLSFIGVNKLAEKILIKITNTYLGRTVLITDLFKKYYTYTLIVGAICIALYIIYVLIKKRFFNNKKEVTKEVTENK